MKYAIISDIHADIKSLKKVLAELSKHKIDKIFCCGDLVGYGNFPDGVINTIKENNILSVAGNHDKAIFREYDYQDMNPKAQNAINENIDYISKNDLDYIINLPDFLTHKNMRFVHGAPPKSYHNYIYYYNRENLVDAFGKYTEQIAFCGHTHKFMFIEFNGSRLFVDDKIEINKKYKIEANERYIINVGSVSLPRGDKTTGNQFVIYDDVENFVEFLWID